MSYELLDVTQWPHWLHELCAPGHSSVPWDACPAGHCSVKPPWNLLTQFVLSDTDTAFIYSYLKKCTDTTLLHSAVRCMKLKTAIRWQLVRRTANWVWTQMPTDTDLDLQSINYWSILTFGRFSNQDTPLTSSVRVKPSHVMLTCAFPVRNTATLNRQTPKLYMHTF